MKKISITDIREKYGLKIDDSAYQDFIDTAYEYAEKNSILDNNDLAKAYLDFAVRIAEKTRQDINDVLKNAVDDFNYFANQFFEDNFEGYKVD